MNPVIKTWTDNNGYLTQKIEILEYKIIINRKLSNGASYYDEYLFKEFMDIKHPIVSAKSDSLIYKTITKQKKPKNLNKEKSKIWNFWKYIDLEKISEQKYPIGKDTFWKKTKHGIFYGYMKDKKERHYSWQRHDAFFFNSVNFPGTLLADKISARQEIFDALDTKSKITINDSFLLFDYDKIKPLKFEKVKGNIGEYIKIEGGKVTVGGWNEPREGGENYSSIEYLWYNMKARIPKIFHKHLPQIKSVLEKAILH